MQSKTSFFNGTIFRKNMTRFAPVWLLYTLCLIMGMALMYVGDGETFWFANRMGELIQYSGLINLFYGPLVAMLLFGDLYNSRMCNALHAMPLKRSCWYGTNVISGLVFSLLPTAILCILSTPLLLNTCVVGAEWIALWAFLGMNLTYLCYFGIAVFSALCAGNRFGMIAMYALINGGAYVVWFLIDSIYTPMLYGVVTPTALVENLTPVNKLVQSICIELDSYNELVDLYGHELLNATADFRVLAEGWMTVGIWALVGVGFLALGRLLYRGRKLECAGDAMAIKALEPVFQVCFAVCAAAFAAMFLQMFFGSSQVESLQSIFLICGLIAGWFGAKMILERAVRVFRFKNWIGLVALSVVLAGSLYLTHSDVFGIESWMPKAEEVKSVTFGLSSYRGMSQELTDKADIEAVIRLQELALEDKLEEGGQHPVVDGVVQPQSITATMDSEELNALEYRHASVIYIYYEMENGRTISREYIVWCDGEEAEIVNEYLSRWEVVRSMSHYYGEDVIVESVGLLSNGEEITGVRVSGVDDLYGNLTEEDVDALLAAIMADCDERHMTQRVGFHTGRFHATNEEGHDLYTGSIWLDLYSEGGYSGDFYVFPDSKHTLAWLEAHDLLVYEIQPTNGYLG